MSRCSELGCQHLSDVNGFGVEPRPECFCRGFQMNKMCSQSQVNAPKKIRTNRPEREQVHFLEGLVTAQRGMVFFLFFSKFQIIY